jgi:glyoxylase-like metal-dependent hydrolase (beta-lactamase superfamily II)
MTPITHSPLIRQITCDNASPFTQNGTNCYIVGVKNVVIIDPGPENPAMEVAIRAATKGETIAAILITHTHKDHSPGAKVFNVPNYGFGKHLPSRELALGEINMLDAAGDKDFTPDVYLKDGENFTIAGLEFEAIHTPGHCSNHLAFAFKNENILFSGDHVMGWSTSIVAPPDGAMGDYMRSLEKLIGRGESRYFAGHGDPIDNPQGTVRAMLGHRRMREASILEQLRQNTHMIPDMVANLYKGLDPRLKGAAALSVYAHLEELVQQNRVMCEGSPQLHSKYLIKH